MFLPDLLAGRHILITGGGTGLGKSMGRRFLELGAAVLDLRPPRRGAGGDRGRAPGGHGRHGADGGLRRPRRRPGRGDAGPARGGGPVDTLVNNAAGNFVARSEDLSPARGAGGGRHRARRLAPLHARPRPPLAGRQVGAAPCSASSPATPGPARPTSLPSAVRQGRRARDDALARGRVGRPWRPPQRHRARARSRPRARGSAWSRGPSSPAPSKPATRWAARRHEELANLAAFLL